MPVAGEIQIEALKKAELEEAERIMRVAFATYLGLPDPEAFMDDRSMLIARWAAPHVHTLGARQQGRLIGSIVLTRWGSFGFLGPLTILPEYWDRGVAQRLMTEAMKIFERQELARTGLFTFPQSAKHVGLYQKFGYWPGYLTALMKRTPEAAARTQSAPGVVHLSTLAKGLHDDAIEGCRKLTDKLDTGLDLADEIRWMLKQKTGEAVLICTGRVLDGFAVCLHGPGSEGGTKTCYIKFAAVRGGVGAGHRFGRLLAACDELALERGAELEAGMNLAREDAYRQMRAHGYRATGLGVAMQRPHVAGLNRSNVYAIEDWR